MSRAFAGLLVFLVALGMDTEPGSREQVRLRAHFDSVLVELRARDVSGFSTAKRAARERLIGWLSEYRDAGLFPLNDRYADPTPIFRDARGVTCAMAYLIERSGRGDIVDRVSVTRNLSYIGDLTSDTSMVAWLDVSGLSVAEAARVQPAYEEEREFAIPLTLVTVGLSTISLFTAHANVFRPSEVQGFAGILVGSMTVMVGVLTSHDYPVLTGINAASGGLAILSGIYAAFRPRDSLQPKRAETRKEGPEWSPLVQLIPRVGGTRVGLTARF